ncbi:hypothetical protein FN846DRAFT_1019397 [Sphaerosporella brunnea]|uniref:Uncharacterized protein n=1 Tax=Sphaerosporella brunnea TaxID=1250544 RepID=A0A5J5F6W9_9PEZI|nr:hypothetical protein FN846DRAFT_1019397 [Sphaerosporella brunnea]
MSTNLDNSETEATTPAPEELSDKAKGKRPAKAEPEKATDLKKRKVKGDSGDCDKSDEPASGPSRPARPPYSQEEDDFIRFCRDDLCQSWEGTQKLFNQHWAVDEKAYRQIPGLQSRYYRLLDIPVRDRKKGSLGRPELGILATTDRRYWWMEGALTYEQRAEMEKEKEKEKEKEGEEKKRQLEGYSEEEPRAMDSDTEMTDSGSDHLGE